MREHSPQPTKSPTEIIGPEVRISPPADFSERLVTLCDGRTGLRSGLQVQVSEPSVHPFSVAELPRLQRVDGTRSTNHAADSQSPTHSADPNSQLLTINSQPILDFIASDETLDRCGEIISSGGWRLESYRRNPVFQNAHQYGDIIFTLGRALITEVRSA